MKKGTVWTACGLLLIAAALCLTLYNLWDNHRASKAAVSALAQVNMQEQTDAMRNTQMPTKNIDGYDYVGVLRIPSLRLVLPVMDEWSYPHLKIAPCRYTGSAYLNNLVIAAHNYDCHFGRLKSLHIGDMLTFVDMADNVFVYRVKELETLSPSAVEDMTNGDWDMTLFTCTVGGQSRVTVRCERV